MSSPRRSPSGARSSTAKITAASEGWPADRLGALERNVLRIGIYELEAESVPPEVAINEAVELAKRYASDEAGRLVNGILGRIARERVGVSAEESLERAEELLDAARRRRAPSSRRSTRTTTRTRRSTSSRELAELAKEIEAELARAKREAEADAGA